MYIGTEQLTTLLHVGKGIEQWIGTYYNQEHDYTGIKWLSIQKGKENEYNIVHFDVFDDGDEEFSDIGGFTAVDPDFTYGKLDTFETAEEALSFAQENYGCKLDKFVSFGMIQNEYDKYLKTRG